MYLRNRITAGFSALVHNKTKVANGLQTGCKGCKKGCKGCHMVRIPFLRYPKQGSGERATTVDGVNRPRSPVSDNTRKGIRQKVAKLQPLQPVCNLFATFQKTHRQAVNPYTMRVYGVHINNCNLCNLFSRVLVYREIFFYFFIFQHNP